MRACLSSFGTIDTGVVQFTIMLDGGRVADWSMPMNETTYTVPGSWPPISVTDIISVSPATVTWLLHLEDREAYHRLRAKLGDVDTLRVLHGLQSHAGATLQIHGVVYDELPYTTLIALGQPRRRGRRLWAVDATFQRTIDPVTGEVQP